MLQRVAVLHELSRLCCLRLGNNQEALAIPSTVAASTWQQKGSLLSQKLPVQAGCSPAPTARCGEPPFLGQGRL